MNYQREHVEVITKKYPNGWLATLNILEAGEIAFGCTGNHSNSPYSAVCSTSQYFLKVWPNDELPADEINSILRELKKGDATMKYLASGEYNNGEEFETYFELLDDARSYAGSVIEYGGFASVTNENGDEYTIF